MNSLKGNVAVKINDIVYLECIVVGYILKDEKITYRVLFEKDVFDAPEEFVMSLDAFYEDVKLPLFIILPEDSNL